MIKDLINFIYYGYVECGNEYHNQIYLRRILAHSYRLILIFLFFEFLYKFLLFIYSNII